MCRKDIASIMNKINEAIGQDLKTTVLKKKIKRKTLNVQRRDQKKKSTKLEIVPYTGSFGMGYQRPNFYR